MRVLNLQLTLLGDQTEAGFVVWRQVLLPQSGQLLQLLRIHMQRAVGRHANTLEQISNSSREMWPASC